MTKQHVRNVSTMVMCIFVYSCNIFLLSFLYYLNNNANKNLFVMERNVHCVCQISLSMYFSNKWQCISLLDLVCRFYCSSWSFVLFCWLRISLLHRNLICKMVFCSFVSCLNVQFSLFSEFMLMKTEEVVFQIC